MGISRRSAKSSLDKRTPLIPNTFDALPLSYFATLASSANVFDKGAERIRHDGSDGYYRALLLLDESRLRPLLPGLEDQSHASIMEAIKDVDADPVVAGAPIQEMPVPEPMPALLTLCHRSHHGLVSRALNVALWT